VGGASTRMGRSKTLLRLDGVTFVERIVATLRARVTRVVLLGDGPIAPALAQVTRVPDVPGLAGPLAGMLAAMRWERRACWIFVACDLPMLTADALDWLLTRRGPGRWVVMPKVAPDRVEPLLAVYEPEALELLERLAQAGSRSPRSLADEPAVYTPAPPAPLRACWTNVNTPKELRRLTCSAADPEVGLR
jgi:molybdopterin-guanine dinucleotide biosynthesis protein A